MIWTDEQASVSLMVCNHGGHGFTSNAVEARIEANYGN